MADFTIVTEIFYSGAWHDISADVRNRDSVTIERGAPDESSAVRPGRMTFTLNNGRSNVGAGIVGRYTPRNPRSDLFGLIGRNTPVRQSIEGHRRFTGEISEWPARWTLAATEVWISVQAFGILRRLGQGGGKPAQTALKRRLQQLPFGFPDAYWPLDEGELSVVGQPLIGASRFERVESSIGPTFQLGAVDLAPWVGSGLLFRAQQSSDLVFSEFGGAVEGMPATVSEITAEWYLRYPDGEAITDTDPGSTRTVVVLHGAGSPAQTWQIDMGTLDQTNGAEVAVILFLGGFDGELIFSESEGSDFAPSHVDGELHHFVFHAGQQAGGGGDDLFFTLYIDGEVKMTNIISDVGTMEGIRQAGLHFIAGQFLVGTTNPPPVAFGHLALRHTVSPGMGEGLAQNTTFDAGRGYFGEAAGARIQRLCAEEAIPFSSIGNLVADTEQLGHQQLVSILELLQQAAEADGGILYEDREVAGLRYATLGSLYNRTPVLALDYASGHISPPFDPTDDDAQLVNDATAKRIDGGEGRFVKETGPLSIEAPPDGVGRYDRAFTLNAIDDERLFQLAATRVNLGTFDETRFPEVGFHVLKHSHLIAQYVALDSGEWITIRNPPPWLPPNEIGAMVRGYRERYSRSDWFCEWNTVPSAPYAVGTLDVDRYDSARASVAASFDTTTMTPLTAGTLSVAFEAGAALATTFFLTDSYTIEAAGVRMGVIAVTGASSPQSFVVLQAGPAIPKVIPAGTPVRLAKPLRYAKMGQLEPE